MDTTNGIIAQQVTFTRTAVKGTWQFHFQGMSLGEVRVVNTTWTVVDEPFTGTTREDAVAKYLVAANLFVE